MCMVDGSTCGFFNSSGIVGSTFAIMFIGMCNITYVSGKCPMCGV